MDTLVGTANNDTFNAVPTNMLGDGKNTLQAFDSIDGGAGIDTLNIFVAAGDDATFNSKQVGTVKNVEIINIYNSEADGDYFGGEDGVDASKFEGAQQIWQIDGAADVQKLAEGTTAGFRNVTLNYGAGIEVAAAATAKTASVALENVDGSSWDENRVILDVEGAALESVSISGNIVKRVEGENTADAELRLSVTAGKNVETLSINTAVDSELRVSEGQETVAGKGIKVVDASASTGSIKFNGLVDGDYAVHTVKTGAGDDVVSLQTVTSSTVAALASTGAGDDVITVETSGAGTTTVDAGAGDDVVTINGRSEGKLTVNLGAGSDTFNVHSSVVINGTDVIDGGAGVDTLLLSLVGSANVGAFSNFELFDVAGLGSKTLDLNILTAKNTVTEIVGSATTDQTDSALINVGAGVGFRAIGNMGTTNAITLTQAVAGALTVTLDADEEEADESGDVAQAKVVATNATSVKAVFDTAYLDKLADDLDNTSTINLSAAKASAIEVVSGGAESKNVLILATDDASSSDSTSALKTITITGNQQLTLDAIELNGSTNDIVINAAGHTGGLITSLANVKNAGSITLGSGTDVITVTTASTTGANGANAESLVGFEKTAAVAVSTAAGDADAKAAAITAADKLAFTGAVADANTGVENVTFANGVLKFTGTGVANLDAAVVLANSFAESVGEALVFEYVGNSYVFVQGNLGADTLVKLVGITGVTNFAEVGDTNAFFIV